MRSVARGCATGSVVLAAVLTGGCGGRTPLTDDIFGDSGLEAGADVDAGPPKLTTSNKADLLFAIDNSTSMGDKQQLLVQAIPAFISRLSNPWCVPQNDPQGIAIPPQNGACATGYKIEFAALKDIHVGIVTSS